MAILKYDTPDGEILIQVEDEESTASDVRRKGVQPAASAGEPLANRILERGDFDAALVRIKAIGNSMARTVSQLDVAPETAEVELAVSFSGDAGVVFAKAGVEAQMKVKLAWKPGQKSNAVL